MRHRMLNNRTGRGMIRVTTTDDGRPVCPVCGVVYPPLSEPAWDVGRPPGELAYPSYDICPECETQFGVDDTHGLEDWVLLRREYLDRHGRRPELVDRIVTNLEIAREAL